MTRTDYSKPETGQVLIAGASRTEADELRGWLKAPGLTVSAESNIDQVRQNLADRQFDCVLVDETLIRSQGMFFLTQGDWNHGIHADLVILMTSSPDEHRELLELYGLNGIDLVMPKPCANEETLAILCHMLQERGIADATHGVVCLMRSPADVPA